MSTDTKAVSAKVMSGLAGAAALAAGSQAYSAVTPAASLPANIPGTVPSTPTPLTSLWDVDGDAASDFVFRYETFASGSWFSGIGSFPPNNAVVGYVGYFGPYTLFYADNLGSGAVVDATDNFVGTNNYAILASRFSGTDYGAFRAPNTRGFVGFKFEIGSNLHFGWIELETSRDGGVVFHSGAYESTPNTPIAIPEPGSLAALAIGAAALLRRR